MMHGFGAWFRPGAIRPSVGRFADTYLTAHLVLDQGAIGRALIGTIGIDNDAGRGGAQAALALGRMRGDVALRGIAGRFDPAPRWHRPLMGFRVGKRFGQTPRFVRYAPAWDIDASSTKQGARQRLTNWLDRMGEIWSGEA